ncbi:MAG: glycosyltransferase [Acetobacteraceae bacterium]
MSRAFSLDYLWTRGVAARVIRTLACRAIAQMFLFSAVMVQYVMQRSDLPWILDMLDVNSEKLAAYPRHASPPMRLLSRRDARTLPAFERLAARECDRTLFVSPAAEARFLRLTPGRAGRADWEETGVGYDYFSPWRDFASPLAPGKTPIVLTGTMDYKPNIDAMTRFADAVLPRPAAPSPIFVVAGAEPPAVKALGRRPNVRFARRMADTRPYLAHAASVAALPWIGRGIRNKVLEAVAFGRPMLASPATTEGVRAGVGQQTALVAASTTATARLAEGELKGRPPDQGAAAPRAAVPFHDWRTMFARLDPIVHLP